jgi:hypothetical protein
MKSLKNHLVLNVFTLHALVVSKPLLDLFAANPEYFVINRIQRADIFWGVVLVSFGLPILVIAAIAVFQKVNEKFANAAQIVAVGAYGFGYVLQITSRLDVLPAAVCVAVGVLAGAALGVLYRRINRFSFVISLASPIVIVFPLLFVFGGNMERVLFPRNPQSNASAIQGAASVESRPPIVFLVLDEFPLTDMLDGDGNIHAERFPNFAELASESTWYENASTIWPYTEGALPTLLTGNRLPIGRIQLLPAMNDFPKNLFSMLQHQYTLNVTEPLTDMLPEKFKDGNGIAEIRSANASFKVLLNDAYVLYLHILLPKKMTRKLPRIDQSWGHFGEREVDVSGQGDRLPQSGRLNRKVQFETFIRTLDTFPKSTLHFFHTVFPHSPFDFLPSGRIYNENKESIGIEEEKPVWKGSVGAVQRVHHALRLQEALADRLVGDLIQRLKEIGLYDESLVIITADHGGSYLDNQPYRKPNRNIFGDVAFVPLFIKYPNQSIGKRDDSNVELIDIVPTIADVIGAELNWEFDGRSLENDASLPRETKVLPNYQGGTIELTRDEYLAAKQVSITRKIESFNLNDSRSDVFRYGKGLEYIGEPQSTLDAKLVPARVQCDALDALGTVDLAADFIPCRLIGTVRSESADPSKLYLAFVVNGKIELIARPMKVENQHMFDVVLPDTSLRQGSNRIVVLLVDLDDDRPG